MAGSQLKIISSQQNTGFHGSPYHNSLLAGSGTTTGWWENQKLFQGFPHISHSWPPVLSRCGMLPTVLLTLIHFQVFQAVRKGMFAVDVSGTTLSVHQVGQANYYGSHVVRDSDANTQVCTVGICGFWGFFLENLPQRPTCCCWDSLQKWCKSMQQNSHCLLNWNCSFTKGHPDTFFHVFSSC